MSVLVPVCYSIFFIFQEVGLLEIQSLKKLKAEVDCPGSKSYTNRALLISALAEGCSRLENPLFSDDTHYMSVALNLFGAKVVQENEGFTVTGTGGKLRAPGDDIFVGNAGTAMRFLTTFSALAPGTTILTGNERMRERPISDLLTALNALGVSARSMENNGCPPLEIKGGGVSGGKVEIAGNKSSQYLTSLLLSAPCFKGETCIRILGDLTSKPYADLTLDIMSAFGVRVENESYREFRVPANQCYQARTYEVEGDWSSASYFFASAAVSGGEVAVRRLNPHSPQGDKQFLFALEQMGCGIEVSEKKIVVKGNPLHGININMNTMPDAAQTLAVVALFAKGKTTITGIANLRIKETDRISALANELSRLGAKVIAGDDYLEIEPGVYSGAEIETYDDHRMAMSFAVAGLKIPGIKIKNPKCVDKSFPDFFERFKKLYE